MKFKDMGGDTRNFLKLKDKESVVGIFAGDVYDFRQHWTDGRGILCTGDECPICKSGKKSSFRFRVNFVVREGDKFLPKVWEQGYTVYKALSELNKEYDFDKYAMKITRHGSGLSDTNYMILPLQNNFITEETKEKLKHVTLNDLGHITPSENDPPPHVDSDIPF